MKQTPEKNSRTGQIISIVLSLVLALGLWMYVAVTESPTGEKTFSSVPIKLSGTDTLSGSYGFTVLSGYDAVADVTLRGRRSELNALNLQDIVCRVDLSDITSAGSYQKKIYISPPAGLETVRCSPEYIVVDIDVEKSVSVPILPPEETATLAEGVKYDRVFSTEMISVKGPQAVVDKIAGAKCEDVDLGEFTKNVSKSVPFYFVDAAGNELTDRYLVPSQNTVVITYTLYKEKTVPLVLDVETLLPNEKVTQSVTPSTVTVQGVPEQIDLLTEIVARRISTADMQTKTSRFSGTVTLPDGLRSATGTITYEAQTTLSGYATKSVDLPLSDADVSVTSPDGMNYTFSTDRVKVTLRTQSEFYADITANALAANIDLSAYTTPGTYVVDVEVTVKAPQNKQAYVTSTASVSVTVSK